MTKIVFLDIDGVLNRRDTFAYSGTSFCLERECVKRMKNILEKTGAQVVLSSVWRKYEEGKALVRWHIEFIDQTKELDAIRGEEIKEWLDRHPDVEKYAILDDDTDMLPGQPLFQTSIQKGLTNKIAQKVIVHLLS